MSAKLALTEEARRRFADAIVEMGEAWRVADDAKRALDLWGFDVGCDVKVMRQAAFGGRGEIVYMAATRSMLRDDGWDIEETWRVCIVIAPDGSVAGFVDGRWRRFVVEQDEIPLLIRALLDVDKASWENPGAVVILRELAKEMGGKDAL